MSNHEKRVLQLVEHIDALVSHRQSPEQVAREIKGFMAPDVVDEALEAWRERVARIESLRDSTTLTGHTREDWYRGPRAGDLFWSALRKYLEDGKFGREVVESIDEESTTVVSCLDAPWASSIDTRGLVVGHVQSGKTANFTAVTARSADAGYRIFIILSGMTNPLRRRTQRRLPCVFRGVERCHTFFLCRRRAGDSRRGRIEWRRRRNGIHDRAEAEDPGGGEAARDDGGRSLPATRERRDHLLPLGEEGEAASVGRRPLVGCLLSRDPARGAGGGDHLRALPSSGRVPASGLADGGRGRGLREPVERLDVDLLYRWKRSARSGEPTPSW